MIAGITGHRAVEQKPGELLQFARLFVERLQDDHGDPLRIITGMAQGWDLAVAQAAADLAVPFVAALPFPAQTQRWAQEDIELWRRLLPRAHHVEIVGALALNVSYIKRDKWIVDRCDALHALDSGRPSGSHTTVLYAEKIGRTVVPLWEPWLRFRAERT